MVLGRRGQRRQVAAGGNTAESQRISIRRACCGTVVLVLGHREFWAKVRRGAVSGGVVFAGRNQASWGLVKLFPGSLAPDERLGYAANRVVDSPRRSRSVHRQTAISFPQRDLGLFGAFALIGAAIVPVPTSARWTMR